MELCKNKIIQIEKKIEVAFKFASESWKSKTAGAFY